MLCSRKDCPGIGKFTPMLVIKASQKGPPRQAELSQLHVCFGHKESTTLTDFLSDEGWNKIAKHLREAGKGSFSKILTTLEWIELAVSNDVSKELPF